MLCTETVNDHLLDTEPLAGLEVAQAIVKDEAPTDEQYADWSEELTAAVERHEAIRESLAELSSDDEQEQASWEAIVASGDTELETLTQRADLIEARDWEKIPTQWARGELGPPTDDALAALGLERSDCAVAYTAPVTEKGSQAFVRSATTVCTEITNRRFAADYDTDADAAVEVLLSIHEDDTPGELPTGTADAMTRVHHEWQRTVEDLESIDVGDASDPQAWNTTIDAAKERVEVFDDRARATESGDEDEIIKAFDLGRYDHPGPDLEPLALEQRSCSGIRF